PSRRLRRPQGLDAARGRALAVVQPGLRARGLSPVGAPRGSEVEHTDDGRYVVVDGRRWRATDPGIPEKVRQELVDELMSARRAVRDGEPGARGRVQDAKVALGERGPKWWEEPDEDGATR